MIKAIIFDMDGVLVDSEYAYLNRITSYLQQEGYDAAFSAICCAAGSDDHSIWTIIGEALHTEFDSVTMMHGLETYTKTHPIVYRELLNEGVEQILKQLKADGYQLALASSSRMAHIEEMMETCQLTTYFDYVLSGEMFEKTKPNPAIYKKAIELLHCDSQECVVIEDSKYGIAAAKGANLYTMARKESRFFVDQQQADIVFHTFEEAYHIICQQRKKTDKNGL